MRHLLENIFSIHPQNTSDVVSVSALIVWGIVWLVMLVDIWQSLRSPLWKIFWSLFASIPLVGGVIYSVYMLFAADWTSAFFWRKLPAGKRKK